MGEDSGQLESIYRGIESLFNPVFEVKKVEKHFDAPDLSHDELLVIWYKIGRRDFGGAIDSVVLHFYIDSELIFVAQESDFMLDEKQRLQYPGIYLSRAIGILFSSILKKVESVSDLIQIKHFIQNQLNFLVTDSYVDPYHDWSHLIEGVPFIRSQVFEYSQYKREIHWLDSPEWLLRGYFGKLKESMEGLCNQIDNAMPYLDQIVSIGKDSSNPYEQTLGLIDQIHLPAVKLHKRVVYTQDEYEIELFETGIEVFGLIFWDTDTRSELKLHKTSTSLHDDILDLVERLNPKELIRLEARLNKMLAEYLNVDLLTNPPITVCVNSEYDYQSLNEGPNDAFQYLSKYFTFSKKFLGDLKESVIKYGSISNVGGQETSRALELDKLNKGQKNSVHNNWKDHAKNDWDNRKLLAEGLERLIEKSEIKSFYDLLNSNKDPKVITWLGQINELHAFINGIAENKAFGSSTRKFSYFKNAIQVLDREGKPRMLSDIKLQKYAYNDTNPKFKRLFDLGRNLH